MCWQYTIRSVRPDPLGAPQLLLQQRFPFHQRQRPQILTPHGEQVEREYRRGP